MLVVKLRQDPDLVVDRLPDEVTADFALVSQHPVQDNCDLGARYAPAGEVMRITPDKADGISRMPHEGPVWSVVFEPSGVWWLGQTLDDLNQTAGPMRVGQAMKAGLPVPGETEAVTNAHNVLRDCMYDYVNDMDEAAGTFCIPSYIIRNLAHVCTVVGVDLDQYIGNPPADEGDPDCLVVPAEGLDSLAARFGLGERLLECNQEALRVSSGVADYEQALRDARDGKFEPQQEQADAVPASPTP